MQLVEPLGGPTGDQWRTGRQVGEKPRVAEQTDMVEERPAHARIIGRAGVSRNAREVMAAPWPPAALRSFYMCPFDM